ncbi:hypothetical protein HDU96_006302 [Phlyctochytrium bullatum]|nr:hypothetical protein HDU96_006302 [Phlyctochytrium bullatum]
MTKRKVNDCASARKRQTALSTHIVSKPDVGNGLNGEGPSFLDYELWLLPDATGFMLYFPRFVSHSANHHLAKLVSHLNPEKEKLEGALFSHLRQCIPWAQTPIKMFGKSIMQPRLTAWLADDPGLTYTYSKMPQEVKAMPLALGIVREAIQQVLGEGTGAGGVEFNSCLANLYRDGSDYMGLHQDNEKELGENPVIASVSLGAARRFTLKRNPGKEAFGSASSKKGVKEPFQPFPCNAWNKEKRDEVADGGRLRCSSVIKVEDDKAEIVLADGSLLTFTSTSIDIPALAGNGG